MRPTRYAPTRGEKLDIDQLLNAVNSLSEGASRRAVVDVLKLHFPEIGWAILGTGVVTAQVPAGYRP